MPSRSERNAISPSALRGACRVVMLGGGSVAAGMGVEVGARVGVGIGKALGTVVGRKVAGWVSVQALARIKRLASAQKIAPLAFAFLFFTF